MSDLDAYAKFLVARWDEQEAVARAAIRDDRPDDGVWRIDNLGIDEGERIDGQGIIIYAEGGHNAAQADHIALHDPAYVLDDLAAKRAILAGHQPESVDFGDKVPGRDGEWGCGTCSEQVEHGSSRDGEWPCPTVAHLAAPFCDHPDHPANREA